MDNNNVLNMIDNTASNAAVLTTSTEGLVTTANCISTPLYGGGYITTTNSYNHGTVVKKAMNGYVVESGYQLFIAKNEKELTKVLMNILNPKQTKGAK